MDISWYGESCFRITERGHTSVITDPFAPNADLAEPRLRADLVTVSHRAAEAGVEGVRDQRYVIRGPGEYEIGELFVTGIPLHIHDAAADAVRENVAYHFVYPNGLAVLHLGALRALPDQSVVEGLDEVAALLLPVGASGVAGDALADLISVIEPKYVVPMRLPGCAPSDYAAALEGFLKAMGVAPPETRDSLRVTSASLPEQTQIALLRPSHTED